MFEVENRTIKQLEDETDEKIDIEENLKDQLIREKILTKREEAKINDFTFTIQKYEQMRDNEKYIEGLMVIYNKFCKQYADQIQEKKRKDPETIEELDRQLKYMEKSLHQLKVTSEKDHQRGKAVIKQRTEENEELIQ